MSCNYVSKLLDNQDDITLLNNIVHDDLDKPQLLKTISRLIADNGPYLVHFSDEKLLSLVRLAKEYFNSCFLPYLNVTTGGLRLEQLLPSAQQIVYYVTAPDGYRVATVKEIEAGVEELECKVTDIISPEVVEYLNLLLWTFNGRLRFYKKAGLTYTYCEGKLVETDYQLICKAGIRLREMIDWISVGGNFDRAITALKKSKRAPKYRYPTFAQDEITCNISAKQICFLCNKQLKVTPTSEKTQEASRILFKMSKTYYNPLPHEVALIRRTYTEITSMDVQNATIQIQNKEAAELCEKLEKGAKAGFISTDDFAFKIISTIKTRGTCSEKQLNVLKEAEKKMDSAVVTMVKTTEKEKKQKEIKENSDESMNELLEMSDLLGSGVLEV